ncbi:vitellogenin receptor Yl [Ciona intestinalis]
MGFVLFAFFVCFISVASSEVWKCDDGLSINSAWRCDGQFDCLDWSDENPDNCPPRECSSTEYKCNNGMCISDVLVCNGEYDCMGDQSDEANCTNHNVDCDVTLFHKCGNNMCIPMEWRCDNEDDCGDNSDEMGCSNVCLHGHVLCNKTGLCISEHWVCDGVKDCVDGEDESHCGQAGPPTPATPCNISAFECDGNCYSLFRACDGHNDCVDGVDEGLTCQVSTCRLRKNDDFVRNMNGGEIVCDHLCIATPSGPRCYCHPGYSLEANGYECKVNGVSPSLYFSSSNQIRRITVHASALMRSDDVIVVDPNQNASITAIQYDTNANVLFWLDSNFENIHTMAASGQQRVVANVPGVTSLAFDWLTHNLYVTRLTPPSVGVIPLTSETTPTTTAPIHLATYLSPTCIALLPHKGIMIVCDHGNPTTNPHLTLLNMDGTSPHIFHTTDLPHIHAVAVDIITDLVYWGETGAGVARVRVKSLDGNHQKVILSSAMGNSPIEYPSSISMFEDDLYFTDPHTREIWRLDSISGKATNFEGEDNEPIVKVAMSDKVLAVHVAHPVQQRAHQPNPCVTSMCTHACVNRPMGSQCLCPPSKVLGQDGKTCNGECGHNIYMA